MKQKIYACALDCARSAGEILRLHLQKERDIVYKGVIDLVTDADKASEAEIIRMIRSTFPEHAILAEESLYSPAESDYCWIIDPLDGTTNYTHRYPFFCISIGVKQGSEMLVGVVYDPIGNEMFSAIAGSGAWLNGQPITVSKEADIDHALLGTGFPYDRRQHGDFYMAMYRDFMLQCQGIRRDGAAALDLCYVACGRFDGFWELKLKPWDMAAGALIIQEAGGQVSNFYGEAFSIETSHVLASNGKIHNAMREILAPYRDLVRRATQKS
jgi:myo-inositol-1(or 4)-monophosphatase